MLKIMKTDPPAIVIAMSTKSKKNRKHEMQTETLSFPT